MAIHPSIDFSFTASTVPLMGKRALLNSVTRYCLEKGNIRSSIWTFSGETEASYSSMTCDNFLGFGCCGKRLFLNGWSFNSQLDLKQGIVFLLPEKYCFAA